MQTSSGGCWLLQQYPGNVVACPLSPTHARTNSPVAACTRSQLTTTTLVPPQALPTFSKCHVFQPRSISQQQVVLSALTSLASPEGPGRRLLPLCSLAQAIKYLMKHHAGWQLSSPLQLPTGRALLLQNLQVYQHLYTLLLAPQVGLLHKSTYYSGEEDKGSSLILLGTAVTWGEG